MNINIFGSTGIIGSKTLFILKKYFPKIKINLLLANKNYKKLIKQAQIYKPKYVFINDETNINLLKENLKNYKIKVCHANELNSYLKSSSSDISVLSISGYKSLAYLESICLNTKNLGLVNKECVVSAGHLFNKIISKLNVKIFPLDSEHFSLNLIYKKKLLDKINKIYLTASGGPFLKVPIKKFKNLTFKEAVNHPKWKMGIKNSIDSATFVNKCLELVEAHHLFNIPYEKLDAVIHPEAYIHSIIEYDDSTSIFSYFYPDMNLPIFNFINLVTKSNIRISSLRYHFNKQNNLSFDKVDIKRFPVFAVFKQIYQKSQQDVIKFNCANEVAVDKFKNNNIKFTDIHHFIDNALSLDFTSNINSINEVVLFQNEFYKILTK